MAFELSEARAVLERTPSTFRSLLSGLPRGWTTVNEGGETWSAFDIVGHLVHGEKTDWTTRMARILDPEHDAPFEPFDRFAQFEDSRGKSLGDLLDEFTALRQSNLETLDAHRISNEHLALAGQHPALGAVTLQELLSTWVVHDLGHIAQTARVMAGRYGDEVGPWHEYLRILQD